MLNFQGNKINYFIFNSADFQELFCNMVTEKQLMMSFLTWLSDYSTKRLLFDWL